MKKEIRGIQIVSGSADNLLLFNHNEGVGVQIAYMKTFIEMTVDCHLGNLIITKDDLLDYLEKRDKKIGGHVPRLASGSPKPTG